MRPLLSKDKKGQVNAMGPAIIALVIAGVFLILGLVMLQELRDADIVNEGANLTDPTYAYTQANETLVGLGTFSDFWEIIVLAIVITIVIGLLLVVFGRRAR